MAAQLLRIGIQTISLIVLARLLSPSDYGYVAMVAAIAGIAELVQDAGLSHAAIQAPTLTRGQRNNLFWLNLGLGAAAATAVALLAPVVAALYQEPVLTEITRWLALVFLCGGLAGQFRASLLRDMRFTAVAAVDILAAGVGLSAAIAVAAAGGTYWALVVQQVSVGAVTCIGIWIGAGWLPGLPRRDESVRGFVSYGFHLLGAQVVNYVSMNVDTVVIGARFGAVSAGLYNRAFQMMMLPIGQLAWPAARVALPVLSRLQDDAQRFLRFLTGGQSVLLHAVMPVLLLAAVVPQQVVEILLGDGWLDLVPVFAILAVGGVFQAASFAQGWVFMATGNTRAQLRFALCTRPVVVAAVLGGSFWGPTGVAAGYSAALAVLWPVGLWWAGRAAGIPVWGVLGNAARAVVGHGMAAGVAAGVLHRTDFDSPWMSICLGAAVMLVVLAGEVAVWRRLREDVREVVRLREFLARTRPRSEQGRRRHRPGTRL
jgi:PST family polysaccharide transporter